LFAFLQVPSSFLGDRFRKKTILLVSAVLEGVTVLIYGLAGSVRHFFFGKSVEGISTSISRSPSDALLVELSEKHRFSESFGNLVGYFSVGYVLGFFIAGPLVSLFGYRRAILSLVVFQAISLAFIYLIQHKEEVKHIKFNLKKFFHKPHRNLKILAFTGLLVTLVEYMDYTVTVIFLKDVYSASLTQIGLFMGLGWLAFGVMQIISGRHADQFGRKKVYVYGGILAGIAVLLIPKTNSLLTVTLFYIVVCLGHGIAFPAIRGITADSASNQYKSQDFGFITTFEEIGGFLGFIAMGWLADNFGFNLTFYLRGTVILLVTAMVYILINEKKKTE
jgi:MFS family permease